MSACPGPPSLRHERWSRKKERPDLQPEMRDSCPGLPHARGIARRSPDRPARAPHHCGEGGRSPEEQTAQHTFSSSSLYQQCAQSQLNFPLLFRNCLPYLMEKHPFSKTRNAEDFRRRFLSGTRTRSAIESMGRKTYPERIMQNSHITARIFGKIWRLFYNSSKIVYRILAENTNFLL